MHPALVLLIFVLAGIRIAGVTHPAFQAAAHLIVGGMFAVGWRGWTWETVLTPGTAAGIVLSIVEVICFVISRSN